MNRSQSSNKNISIESQTSITQDKARVTFVPKRPNTQLKSRGTNRMDRKRGAGLITGNESPNGNKKDILDMMGGIQTDVTIRNDDLSVE
jgi:hypothetical protein